MLTQKDLILVLKIVVQLKNLYFRNNKKLDSLQNFLQLQKVNLNLHHYLYLQKLDTKKMKYHLSIQKDFLLAFHIVEQMMFLYFHNNKNFHKFLQKQYPYLHLHLNLRKLEMNLNLMIQSYFLEYLLIQKDYFVLQHTLVLHHYLYFQNSKNLFLFLQTLSLNHHHCLNLQNLHLRKYQCLLTHLDYKLEARKLLYNLKILLYYH